MTATKVFFALGLLAAAVWTALVMWFTFSGALVGAPIGQALLAAAIPALFLVGVTTLVGAVVGLVTELVRALFE